MSFHLDKAKAALDEARQRMEGLGADDALPQHVLELLDVARVQASVAAAEALERVAERLAPNERGTWENYGHYCDTLLLEHPRLIPSRFDQWVAFNGAVDASAECCVPEGPG